MTPRVPRGLSSHFPSAPLVPPQVVILTVSTLQSPDPSKTRTFLSYVPPTSQHMPRAELLTLLSPSVPSTSPSQGRLWSFILSRTRETSSAFPLLPPSPADSHHCPKRHGRRESACLLG